MLSMKIFPGFNFSEYTDFFLSFFLIQNYLKTATYLTLLLESILLVCFPVETMGKDGWRGQKANFIHLGEKSHGICLFFFNWICYNTASFCLFVFIFWLFGPQDRIFGRKIILATCRISAHQPGIEPTPPALEGEVLTTEQPGKLLTIIFEWWTLMVIENDLSIPDA